jgi:class 3 adenylate cyclase/tetratricopeptide (TPR) repeat protein
MAACRTCGSELPSDARFCPTCGASVAAERGEERKVVTVLFADLVDSTASADERDPEDVRAAVRPQVARMREELERFGGTFEKYIGDAMMAVFGAPLAHEDDPERAVRAALAIRDALPGVRVAVNTGDAVVSLGAASGTGEGIATGDVVNTTFRIEEAAASDTVLVGEPTYRATQSTIEYGERRLLQARGKAKPVVVYEALRTSTELGATDGAAPLAPLVGRKEELGLILDTLSRARRHRTAQLLTLAGVPGIGKSRLIWELERALSDEPGLVTWRRGRCLPYGEGVTFWALGEIVKVQAGILETDDAEAADQKLGRAVRDLVDPGEAAGLEQQLRPLVGHHRAETRAEPGRGDAFDAWRRFVEALAERGPLVLVFEDLHWADEGLLDFIEHLADRCLDSPLLLLCTTRPELHERRSWGGRANSANVALAPLSNDETATLVSYLLMQRTLPEQLRESLVGRAEGNPLYAEEYVRMLVDRGLLVRDDGAWRLDETTLPLPETVGGILAARLDALPASEKAVVHDAAVIGRSFWPGAIAAVGEGDHRSLVEDLEALERRELIRRRRSSGVAGETQYVFRHALVHDAAYSQIPRAARGQKHRLAAEWIEGLGGRGDHAEMLAHHYTSALDLARAAGQPDAALIDRARLALRDAGEHALELNAFEPAARFLSAALELWPDDGERPRLLLMLGKSLLHARKAGDDELVAARDSLAAQGDHEAAAEAEVMLATLASFVHGDRDRAFRHLERAAELVESLPPSPAKAYVLASFANSLGLADERERAVVEARRALAIAEELGLDEIRARSLNTIGWLEAVHGREEGLANLEQSIEIAESINSPNLVPGYVNLAGVHIVRGDLPRAFEVLAAGRRAVARFGRVHATNWLLDGSQVFEDWCCGRWDAALARADEIVREEQDHFLAVPVRIARGHIRGARGDLAGMLDDSERALEAARPAKDTQLVFPALAFRARALVTAGANDEAGKYADELLSELQGDEWCMDWFWADLAVALYRLERRGDLVEVVGRVTNVTRWVEAALELGRDDPLAAAEVYSKIGMLADEADLRLLAAEKLSGDGRELEASEQRARAKRFSSSVGATAAPAAWTPSTSARQS